MTALEDFLSLDEAVLAYRTSKTSLRRFMAAGQLTRYRRHGDRRTLVLRSELDQLFTPRPAPRERSG